MDTSFLDLPTGFNIGTTKKGNNKLANDFLRELDELSGGPASINLECPSPLVPYHNKIVPADDENDSRNRKIPKVIHLSMRSRCLPKDLIQRIERWAEQFPSYSIFFHDDDAVARLIQQEWKEFPDLPRAMHCVLSKGAMTIDIWRVLILYKYGGVYSDIDNWPEDIMNETIVPDHVSFYSLTDGYNRPSQWFMSSVPFHPLLYFSMRRIIINLHTMKHIQSPNLVFETGPDPVGLSYQDFLALTELENTDPSYSFMNNGIIHHGVSVII